MEIAIAIPRLDLPDVQGSGYARETRTAGAPPPRDFMPWRFSDAGARAREWFRHSGVRKPAQKLTFGVQTHNGQSAPSSRTSEAGSIAIAADRTPYNRAMAHFLLDRHPRR